MCSPDMEQDEFTWSAFLLGRGIISGSVLLLGSVSLSRRIDGLWNQQPTNQSMRGRSQWNDTWRCPDNVVLFRFPCVFFVFSYGLVCPCCKVMEWCAFLPLLAVGISAQFLRQRSNILADFWTIIEYVWARSHKSKLPTQNVMPLEVLQRNIILSRFLLMNWPTIQHHLT